MDRNKIALHFKHHGVLRTLLVYAFTTLRRFISFDVMRVETAVIRPTQMPDTGGIDSREVSATEFHKGIDWLDGKHQRYEAFARGDRCFANLDGTKIVGYQFFANQITNVRRGLGFCFPKPWTHVYAGYTHPDYRGRRLSLARSVAASIATRESNEFKKVTWYISVINLASTKSRQQIESRRIGYVAFVLLGQRFFCYASPGCKREGMFVTPANV